MRDNTIALQAKLKEIGIGPATYTKHQTNGKTSLVWYVDNDDDRYVELTDSVNSNDFVLVRRDRRSVYSIVLGDNPTTVAYVQKSLLSLQNGLRADGSP